MSKLKNEIESLKSKENISEDLLGELTNKNYEMEDTINELNKQIDNLKMQHEDNLEIVKLTGEINQIKNSLNNFCNLVGKLPAGENTIDLIKIIYTKTEELLKEPERNQIELLNKELEKAKNEMQISDELLNKIQKLEERIEELMKDKTTVSKENELLLSESNEYKEVIEQSFELVIKSMQVMKIEPEKTKKLLILCNQLYKEISKKFSN